MTLADDIREHVKKNYIDPARRRGERTVTFKASDIHKAMGLNQRFPAVVVLSMQTNFLALHPLH
jgi:hypothetical protein